MLSKERTWQHQSCGLAVELRRLYSEGIIPMQLKKALRPSMCHESHCMHGSLKGPLCEDVEVKPGFC